MIKKSGNASSFQRSDNLFQEYAVDLDMVGETLPTRPTRIKSPHTSGLNTPLEPGSGLFDQRIYQATVFSQLENPAIR
jgi:hypothetical protein